MKEPLVLVGIGLLFVVCAIGALVGLTMTEPILTLDGLMELAVCLLVAGVFTWFAASTFREASRRAAKKGEEKAATAAPSAPAGGEKTA